ncbi:MAG: DNA primase [Bacillota bacterium]
MGVGLAQAVEEIKARVDIVSVVEEYVRLRKAGKNYVGLCPFHSEKTPSFTVSPDKQIFYCFGCHEGGDVFTFLMKRENLSFVEAVRTLAEKLGLRLELSQGEDQRSAVREQIMGLLERASEYFIHNFNRPEAGKAVEYVEKRGITPDIAGRFGLGYALAEWDRLCSLELKLGTPKELLVAAGLAVEKDGGGLYDRFRDKLMFPIRDMRGRTVAFGARVLDDSQPKYVNSPENPVFKKGNVLYGLDLAHRAIRQTGCVILVEGYMDAIACHQFGFDNCVATLGTALSEAQARTLASMASTVIIAYDSDAAGQAATLRGIELFRKLGCDLRVAQLPEGKDPDEFLRKHGAGAFQEVLDNALPYMDHRFKLVCAARDLSTPEGRLAAAKEAKSILAATEDLVEREIYAKKWSELLGLPVGLLGLEAARQVRHKKPARSNNSPEQSVTKMDRGAIALGRAESALVALLLRHPELAASVKEQLGTVQFKDEVLGKIARRVFQLVEKGEYRSASQLIQHDDLEVTRRVSELAVGGIESADPGTVAADCIRTMKKFAAARLLRMIKETSDPGKKRLLLNEYYSLVKQIKCDPGVQGGGAEDGS